VAEFQPEKKFKADTWKFQIEFPTAVGSLTLILLQKKAEAVHQTKNEAQGP